MKRDYTVAVYYFPQWHHDPQHTASPDWTEWEVLKKAVPRFEGHNQPKTPVWGYLDESLPSTSEIQIDAAADHGIDVFIYDWYWDMNGENTDKFLHSALEKGFLKAKNRDRMKFGLMLCNHRPLSRERWDKMVDVVIDTYFGCPEYWEVDGGKYFSIYELHTLVKGLGGLEETKDAIRSFYEKAEAKGYKLHLNFVEWGLQKPEIIGDADEAIKYLDAKSVTSYVWIHNHVPKAPLYAPYSQWRDDSIPCWDEFDKKFSVDYYPNVSMGWDSSGRFDPNKEYVADNSIGAYYCTIMSDNTPAEFEIALQKSKEFLDRSKNKNKFITIYAWNEWTEGGYIEPEAKYGYGYLEAIRNVFGVKEK